MVSRIITCLAVCLVAAGAFGFTADELWEAWPEERFTDTLAPCLRHTELGGNLRELATLYPDRLRLEAIGDSFLGRPIQMLTLGRGARRVLLWSQMHGDEPSATPALLDIVHYLLGHADEVAPRLILDELTLFVIPMLNPDGAELYLRRNAQGIDINRDALNLATPEGRILKAVRDRYEPMLGFNLHDQNRRTAAGDTRKLATNSVLAVAGDAEGTVTPGRLRAKRACSAIVEALAPFMPGGMARYDEDWSPRAFGDNLTAWGTPVVLIESGGLPPGRDLSELTRLNFVALLTVLQDLAADDLAGHDPEVYESLPRNQSNSWAEVVVRDGYLLQPGTTQAFRSDLAFYRFEEDRQIAGCAEEEAVGSGIFEIGDGRFIGAGLEVDAANAVLLAPFVVGVKGWSARKWLDHEVMAELAGMGVGTVRWTVGRDRIAAANEIANRMQRPGQAKLEVIPQRSTQPPIGLRRSPARPASSALADILSALRAAPAERADRDSIESLQVLWPEGLSGASELPVIRRGQPASFLLVSPAPEGRIDLNTTHLEAVWLDGVEIETGR